MDRRMDGHVRDIPDMGAAFMVALVSSIMLVVWEFGNFRIPALIMAPIPLTLLGIVLHARFWALNLPPLQ